MQANFHFAEEKIKLLQTLDKCGMAEFQRSAETCAFFEKYVTVKEFCFT